MVRTQLGTWILTAFPTIFPTVFLAACLMAAAGACRDSTAAGAVRVSRERAYPAPEGSGALVFLSLENAGPPTALVGARSGQGRVEIRTYAFEDGVQVAPFVPRLEIPSNLEVSLRPGGVHLALETERPLEPGQPIDVTLLFEDGSEASVQIPVKAPPGSS